MSSVPSRPSARGRTVAPLPRRTVLLAGVLLLIPMIALAVVPLYSRHDPVLLGFPFFYWYQIVWVFFASGFTWAAYRVITRARGKRR